MTTPAEHKVVVSAQIPRAQREKLERMAADDERTISALVRRAVSEYLEREQGSSSAVRWRAAAWQSPPPSDVRESR